MKPRNIIVCKFGGSSLSDADQIRQAVHIMLSRSERRIMVVSAPGRRHAEDRKITDLLIQLAQTVRSDYPHDTIMETIAERYAEIGRELGLEDDLHAEVLEDLRRRIDDHARASQTRLTDALKAAGEDLCARLVARYITASGMPARYLHPAEAGLILKRLPGGRIRVTDEGMASLRRLQEIPELIVFPGFFGIDEDGHIMTFSRGGSDITGSILAAALGARLYENWTDVDCVYAADPSIIPHPHAIREMTYAEMRELAYGGFAILHEEALEPVLAQNIPLQILNTNHPEGPGTRIVKQRRDYDGIITGIAGSKGFVAIRFQKYLMNREIGFATKILKIFSDYEIPLDHIPTGIDSLSVVTREYAFPPDLEREVIERLKDEVGLEDHEITVQRGIAMVVIVGDALPRTVGLLSRALVALSDGGINLEFIVQAAGEISVLFGIEEEYCHYAIQLLYKCYFSHLQA